MQVVLHQAAAERRLHAPLRGSLVLGRQAVGQPVQSRVEGPGHVGVGRLGPLAEGRGGAWREAVDERGEEVGVAGLSRLDQTVHVDAEGHLLEGAGESTRGEVLEPGEQRQIQLVTTVPTQHVHAEQHLSLCDLLACSFTLKQQGQTECIGVYYRQQTQTECIGTYYTQQSHTEHISWEDIKPN